MRDTMSSTESKKIITLNATHAPAALGPYSHAAIAHGFIFVSGQLGLEAEKMILPEGIEAQTHLVFKNIAAILTSCNKTFADIVKTTIFLKNMNDFAGVNIIYANYFSDHRPARSCIEVARLPKDALIEIEVIAC